MRLPGRYGRRPCGSDVRSTRKRKDRKSTRLNSSHSQISYAVFCLKKKKTSINLDFSIIHQLVVEHELAFLSISVVRCPLVPHHPIRVQPFYSLLVHVFASKSYSD